MPQIFISYRRSDNPYVPLFIRDRLINHFGRDTVFMDVHNIPVGVDFVEHLSLHLRCCDILLAIIGDGWLNAVFEEGQRAGQRRLDDSQDFVRQEIALALARKIPVIPVLLGRAQMPGAAALPVDLALLAKQNAAELRPGRDFMQHMERLIHGIEAIVGRRSPRGTGPFAECQVDPDSVADAKDRQSRWADYHQTPVELVNTLGMKFAWIPPGVFRMGSPQEEKGREEAEIPHNVTITTGFYLGVTAVTQSQWQWQQTLGVNGSRFRGDQRPAESLTWHAASEFCSRLRSKDGRPYRLPTEAEWEYVCRAGTVGPYHTGANEKALGETGWYAANSAGQTQEVGLLLPNAWGLFDMHGNVWEWCSDWYGVYEANLANPTGAPRGDSRVLRGGSWKDEARRCRSARRLGYGPDYCDETIGCRVCFHLEDDHSRY